MKPTGLTVVLDTNVWLSGIFFRRGIPARILEAWRDGHFEIIITPATFAELEATLRKKTAQFYAPPELAAGWLEFIRTYSNQILPTEAVNGVCRDPKDDKFLEAAIAGGAQCLVSGDKDLLTLDTYRGVKILSPRAFADLFKLPA